MKPESPEHASQRAKILALVDKHKLAGHREAIAGLIKPAIGLKTRKPKKADAALGVTRVGGEPDVPTKFAWPEADGAPLLFVMQVDLAEVTRYDLETLLPEDGLLSLFADPFVEHVTVRYFAKGTPLRRHEWVPEDDEAFVECGVNVRPELQIPPPSSAFVGTHKRTVLKLSDEEHERWDAVWLTWRAQQRRGEAGEVGIHQLLGYAAGDDSGDQAKDEEVLFGFDSDDRANMEWGDVQTVWALIKRNALSKQAWKKLRAST
jgi:hypothetical protein